jgi:hypothetical protein
MSHTSQILAHLEKGNTLTALEALKLFGCMRLSARIYDLKDLGWPIGSITIQDGDKRYSQYYMRTKK